MPTVPEQYILLGAEKIAKARSLFDNIINRFGGENVILGITSAGKTKLISDALAEVVRYGSQGSLWEAYLATERVVITAEMAPYLTEARKQVIKNRLIEILSSL